MSDLISREALLEKLEEHIEYADYDYYHEEPFINLSWEMVENIVGTVPSVQQWIPCSERLPKCNGCYLVWRPHFFGGEIGMPAICYFDGQDTWHDSYGVDFTRILNAKDVIAWMPLPEPYKGE